MTRVRLLQPIDLRGLGSLQPSTVLSVPDNEANGLISRGLAVAVRGGKQQKPSKSDKPKES